MKENLDEVQGLLLVYQGFYLNANLSIKQVLISNRRQCQLCLLRAVLSSNESLHTTVNVRPRSMAPK